MLEGQSVICVNIIGEFISLRFFNKATCKAHELSSVENCVRYYLHVFI